jgi:hypothetical protein
MIILGAASSDEGCHPWCLQDTTMTTGSSEGIWYPQSSTPTSTSGTPLIGSTSDRMQLSPLFLGGQGLELLDLEV